MIYHEIELVLKTFMIVKLNSSTHSGFSVNFKVNSSDIKGGGLRVIILKAIHSLTLFPKNVHSTIQKIIIIIIIESENDSK